MKKYTHSLTHDHLTSFDMGELVPIGIKEVVQGETWQMASSALVRCAPMLAPVMHPTHITIHHWFVPYRLIWTDFEDFITGGPAGTSEPVHPYMTMPNSGAGGVTVGSLADYLGVPLGYNADNTGYQVSALPFRAYNMIWNEFYRDEDLQTEAPLVKTSGADAGTADTLLNVCWEKDYFTSARLTPQKGPEVTLPLGTQAPITGLGKNNATFQTTGATVIETDDPSVFYQNFQPIDVSNADTTFYVKGSAGSGQPEIYADLTNATAASISDFRFASSVQRFMENASRYGSRFIEYLRRQGIKSSDARLQLPEYLGGGKQTIQFSEVLQTGVDTNDEGVGTLRGHGIAGVRSNRFIRFFEEPGFIITLAHVLPRTVYMQGMERFWTYEDKFDYFQPELQFIGQQQIKNKEVYAAHTTPDGVFGYQDRGAHLTHSLSRVSGEFRTSTMDFWHFAREFGVPPTLNGTFVQAVPPDRPFALPDEDVLQVMVHHSIQKKSPVIKNPTPRIL